MSSNKVIENNSILIFGVIAIWYAVTNLLWWYINTPVLPFYDSSAAHFLETFKHHPTVPPLITWIIKFMFFIFGKDYFDLIIIFINYIFFLIPLYFIYKIGKAIDSREAGNIAMIIFALVPAVYGLSRQFGHKDYHIIAAMTFNVYCLIKTDYFKNRKWAIIYGISVGLGLLVKEQFLAYFFMPFLWTAITSLKEKSNQAGKEINILISLMVGIMIAGIYYFNPLAIKKIFTDPLVQSQPIFSFDSIRVMTFGLYEELLSLPIFLVCLAGLWYFIKRYKNKNKAIILLWIFVPWIIVFLMPHHKLSEYFAGFIPALILVGSIFISNIKRYEIKKIFLIFLIIIGAIQYINFSYFPLIWLSKIDITINEKYFPYYHTDSKNIMNANVKYNSKIMIQLVEFIDKLCPQSKFSVYVDDKSVINNKLLRSAMLLKNMKCLPRDVEKFILRYDQDAIVVVGSLPLGIKKNKKIINQNFDIVATAFYFAGIKDKSNQIRIFKRKQTE